MDAQLGGGLRGPGCDSGQRAADNVYRPAGPPSPGVDLRRPPRIPGLVRFLRELLACFPGASRDQPFLAQTKAGRPMSFRAPRLMAAAVSILAMQAAASHWLHREPYLPSPPPLAALPFRVGDWTQLRDSSVEPDALLMLGPDDALVREYQLGGGRETARSEEHTS